MKVHIISNLLNSIKLMKKTLPVIEQSVEESQKPSIGLLCGISYRPIDKSIHIATAKAGDMDSAHWYTLKQDGTLFSQSRWQKKPDEYRTYNTWSLYGKIKKQYKGSKGNMDNVALEKIVNDIEKVIKS